MYPSNSDLAHLQAPLSADRHGFPVVYPVLGITVQIADAAKLLPEALAAVSDIVQTTLGDSLGWSLLRQRGRTLPFDAGVLGYLTNLSAGLQSSPQDKTGGAGASAARGDFSLLLKGGQVPHAASPWFFQSFLERVDDYIKVALSIRLTVPADYSPTAFEAVADRLVAAVPFQWATAGFTYATWTAQEPHALKPMFAHARRYRGFDLPMDVAFMERWVDRLRSVNWLTYLGGLTPTEEEVAAASGLGVEVTNIPGHAWKFKASPTPLLGDVNRLQECAGYASVDIALRRLRAREVSFGGPWRLPLTLQWLSRFERQVV